MPGHMVDWIVFLVFLYARVPRSGLGRWASQDSVSIWWGSQIGESCIAECNRAFSEVDNVVEDVPFEVHLGTRAINSDKGFDQRFGGLYELFDFVRNVQFMDELTYDVRSKLVQEFREILAYELYFVKLGDCHTLDSFDAPKASLVR